MFPRLSSPALRRVRIGTRDLRLRVDAEGAAIRSIRAVTRTGTAVEILASTPWAEDPADAFTLPTSSQEWHRRYPGGWHTLVPRALGPVVVDGVAHPFHGEAAWRRWRLVRTGRRSCVARVLLRTVPLTIERAISVQRVGGAAVLSVDQAVTNTGSTPVSIGWVEHPAFAGDVLAAAEVTVGGRSVDVGPLGSSRFDVLPAGDGTMRALDHVRGLALVLRWDANAFPHVCVWRERRAQQGFPWYGAVDAVGIEPASQVHPVADDVLGDMHIEPGERRSARFTLEVGAAGPLSGGATGGATT